MKRLALFALTLVLCAYFFSEVDRMHRALGTPLQPMLLPSRELTRVLSFGHELLLAQVIFYNTMFFVGSLEEPPKLATRRELYHTFDTGTYLDPYNIDLYYFAQGVLSWNRSLIEPLNTLIRRGMAYRTWDWQLPFFYGFNQFYFLKRPEEAAIYLKRAYELNPGNTFLPTFIARLYYQADETKVAIGFLEEMLQNTTNENLRLWMTVRLEAFRVVAFLEDAVARYQQQYSQRPGNLEALVEGRILKAIPPDPYGGRFYLDKSGKVKTSSEFTHARRGPAKTRQGKSADGTK